MVFQKISVLQHAPSAHLPTRPGDPTPTSRNLDPLLHPFARARERMRALNAAKMDRIFAKPFVASLEGHIDAVEVLCRKPGTVNIVASGSWDGGVIVHNIAEKKQLHQIQDAHKGKISGLCFADRDRLLSCGVDCNIKLWDTAPQEKTSQQKPLDVFAGKSPFKYVLPSTNKVGPLMSFHSSIDHHRTDALFATASNIVQIWDENKSAAISNLTFPTATETVTSVRFNLAEASVLGSIGSDRSFTLYDIRTGKAERRVIMQMQSNALSWSPTFPTSVLLASEDHNLYTFDVRNLSTPTHIYKAHVAAVMSCDWSPTGLEFVSGGWDRTLRIWMEGRGTQPEVYHTKRMQRVSSSIFTADARFVLSGSDDGNVRIWKAKASEKLGIITARERAVIEYRESLRDRWKHDQEVSKISRTRHLPKPVYQASKLKRTMLEAQRVKDERRRKHTRAGESKPKAERKKVVLAEHT
ncbi:WD40 repeat-like protein [Lanmaoa asiatica]|nr:WD40 repeat-like protein [Lanmaoa asiatica]